MSDQKRIEDLGTFEMVWDCKFCGTQNLPARTHKFCPNCGAAQDPRTRRFPSDEDKKAVEDYVHKGVDVVCASCQTPNPGDEKFCFQCGAPLENAARVETLGEQVRGEGQAFAAMDQRNIEQESFQRDLREAGVATDEPPKSGRRNWLLFAVIGVVVLVIVGIASIFLLRNDTNVYVTGHEWERVINIESLEPRSEVAWCDAMPGDAYSVTRREEQRETRRVRDGETCEVRRIDNGDGTFSERRECSPNYRQEPVYDMRCYFTVDRWDFNRAVNATGLSLAQAPYWPEANISRTGNCIGCERESGRDENYMVTLQGEGDAVYECELDYETWLATPVEAAFTMQVSAVTGQAFCDTLERVS